MNSSKLGSSGRLKTIRAPAEPPRAISGTDTSLQAIAPPLVCLSLLVATGLRVSLQRRASSCPTISSCWRAKAMSASERPQTTRDSSRGKTAVAAVQPSRRHTARNTLSVPRSDAAPESREVVSDGLNQSLRCSCLSCGGMRGEIRRGFPEASPRTSQLFGHSDARLHTSLVFQELCQMPRNRPVAE